MWPRRTPAISSVLALVLLAGCGRPAARPAASFAPAPGSGTDGAVVRFQQAAERGGSAGAYSALGSAYLQKWRETADPAFYARAEPALLKALELAPGDVEAQTQLGALAASRHDFPTALEWAGRALAHEPLAAAALGVRADALVELGRYPEAVDTVQRMVDRRPDQASYSRVSYLRELHGDVPGAVAAMQLAVDAGAPTAEGTNWARYQLGMLHFNDGQRDEAESLFSAMPGYLHAEAGLATVAAAHGDYARAIDLYESVTRRLPLPQYLIELADVYQAADQLEAARREIELVQAVERLYQANGANVDLEMALFDADHDLDLPSLAAAGRKAVAERPSVAGLDVLAWTLYKVGEYDEAARQERQALALGTRSAVFRFHLGMIERALGHSEASRSELRTALAINPHFSVRYAPLAQELAS